MVTVTSFHLFPLLPSELKVRIYRLALEPRTVPVRLKLDLDKWSWSTEKDWWTCYAVVADRESPLVPLPAVLSARYEAWEDLKWLYGGLQIRRGILETLLGVDSASNKRKGEERDSNDGGVGVSLRRLLDNLLSAEQRGRRPSFNADKDVLAWKDTQRWASCGEAQLQTLVHPLFLAACLSVRYVSLEYTSCMANLLEVLAFSVLDTRQTLEGLDLSVKNPSDCRTLRFRLCKVSDPVRLSGERTLPPDIMGAGTADDSIEDLVRRYRLVWFPWFREKASRTDARHDQVLDPVAQRTLDALTSSVSPYPVGTTASTKSPLSDLLRSPSIRTTGTAILQVLSSSDPTTRPGASGTLARTKALVDPSRVKFHYQFSEEPFCFGMGNLQTDVLLWCRALTLHGAGYPANLPFSMVGVPCHGFCDENIGLGG